MEIKRPGVFRWDGGHQLLAELANVLRFGAVVRQHRHLLIDLGGSLETELALFVTGHVSIAGIGELRTGRLWVGLRRQQQHNQPQPSHGKRASPVECLGLKNVIPHRVCLLSSRWTQDLLLGESKFFSDVRSLVHWAPIGANRGGRYGKSRFGAGRRGYTPRLWSLLKPSSSARRKNCQNRQPSVSHRPTAAQAREANRSTGAAHHKSAKASHNKRLSGSPKLTMRLAACPRRSNPLGFKTALGVPGARWFGIGILALQGGEGLIGLEIGSHDVSDCCFEVQALGQKRLNPEAMEGSRIHLRGCDDAVQGFQLPGLTELFSRDSVAELLAKLIHLLGAEKDLSLVYVDRGHKVSFSFSSARWSVC